LHAGQRAQQCRTDNGRQDRSQTESQYDPSIRVLSHQRNLEDIVGAVHDGRGRNRHLDRVKQCKHGEQQSTETKTGIQGQARRKEGRQSNRKVGGHPICLPSRFGY